MLINIGCGQTFDPSWENFDFISSDPSIKRADLRKGIPLPTECADVVYHSHVLEHLTQEEANQFIKECHRLLKKDGTLRIAVPDLEGICRSYIDTLDIAKKKDRETHNHEWMVIELIDQIVRTKSGGKMAQYWKQHDLKNAEFITERIGHEFTQHINPPSSQPKPFLKKLYRYTIYALRAIRIRSAAIITGLPNQTIKNAYFRTMGENHQWMYDVISLSHLLKQHGFNDIHQYKPGDSSIPKWDEYALEVRSGKILKPDSLIIEAKKS